MKSEKEIKERIKEFDKVIKKWKNNPEDQAKLTLAENRKSELDWVLK